MKETAKQQLNILHTKRENITKNISNINLKILSLQNQLEKETKALEKIDRTISNFGVKAPREEKVQYSNTEVSASPTEDIEE